MTRSGGALYGAASDEHDEASWQMAAATLYGSGAKKALKAELWVKVWDLPNTTCTPVQPAQCSKLLGLMSG